MGLKGLKGPNLVFMGGGVGNVVPTDRELQEELQNNTPPLTRDWSPICVEELQD